MTDINDDLLPGDEDAILDDLAKNDRTAIAAEAIRKQLAEFAKQQDFLADVKGMKVMTNLLNRDTSMASVLPTRMPLMSIDDDEDSAWNRSYLSRYGTTLVKPKHTAIITNVGC